MRLFGYAVVVTKWEPKASILDFSKWHLGREAWGDTYGTSEIWVGPFHIIIDKVPLAAP